jgi:DNA modification methylase
VAGNLLLCLPCLSLFVYYNYYEKNVKWFYEASSILRGRGFFYMAKPSYTKEYLDLLKSAFSETYRVLINGGRACINVANLGRKPYIPLSDYISKMMIDIGFNMRGDVMADRGAARLFQLRYLKLIQIQSYNQT